MSRRYRHIPLSDDRLRHYEKMRFHVTRKRFGEYTDVDLDISQHCTEVRIPYFIIHNPRRYCTVEMDWSTAGLQLTLPACEQVRKWALQAQEASSAPKQQRKPPFVIPRHAVVHGLELNHAQQLCNRVWEYLLTNAPIATGPEGGDVA